MPRVEIRRTRQLPVFLLLVLSHTCYPDVANDAMADYKAADGSPPAYPHDLEKTAADQKTFAVDQDSRGSGDVVEYQGTAVKQDNGILSKLRRMEASMDRKMGVEAEAIDRKLPEDRKPVSWHSQLTMFFLWASGTLVSSAKRPTTVSLGD